MRWTTTRFQIDLSKPRVMGIVNLTPDSFADGGRWSDAGSAIRHAEQLLREGADLLDLGAESSRPGAARVSTTDEWQRLAPVLREVLRLGVPVSVDTCKTEVMSRALAMGVDVINDVQALRAPGALALIAAHSNAGVCLMHTRGEPAQMQQLTDYADVGAEVLSFLRQRTEALIALGVDEARIVLDPGFGFAKTARQNMAVQLALEAQPPARPWLAGWSRKSSLAWITGAPVADRLPASLAAALVAVKAGARLLRVHDVAATVQALRTWGAMTAPVVENGEI
jgi:dihydropteroate synthase